MNKPEKNNLLIIAGETSGDLIGGALIEQLKKINPQLNIVGIGGDKMAEAGMQPLYHINQMAFLGFAEVVKHLPFIHKVQKNILEIVKTENIKNVVLIDYPGFNLSIAKKLKAAGIKIIYYVSPQLWAWGAGRVKKIKKLVNRMLVVFPFEEKFYKKFNIKAEFVGHPISERAEKYTFLSRKQLYQNFSLNDNKEILLIMPGSRKQEVKQNFSHSINAAVKLAEEFNLQVIVAGSQNIDDEIYYSLSHHRNFKIIREHNFDFMLHSKLGIIKSGTSTLEAAYFALPMIIIYKTSALTYAIGKQMVKIDSIGMANILLEEHIVPELIQSKVNEKDIYNELKKFLTNRQYYESVKEKLSVVKEKLGGLQSSVKAAEIINAEINEL